MVISHIRQVFLYTFTVVHMHTLFIHNKLQLLKYLRFEKWFGAMLWDFRKVMEKKWGFPTMNLNGNTSIFHEDCHSLG